MLSKTTFAAFAAFLAAALTSSTTLAGQLRPSPSGIAAPQAAAQTLGVAIMSAWVHTDGSIVRGAGVVDATFYDTKSYDVKFNRPLNGCVSTVSALSASSPVLATSWVVPDTDYVQVVLWLDSGGKVAYPFQLIVFCAK